MSIEEKEERIIKLNEERLDLIKELKKIDEDIKNVPSSLMISKRIIEIDKEIEELIASAKPNRS